MKVCDMCGTEIKDKKCSCGTWLGDEETMNSPFKKAIEKYNDMKRFTLTGDCPHLGCAFVFFRGDYEDTQKVQEFIYTMKKRPHYTQDEN